MTNSWRALARMARDRLVTSDPEDLNLVLSLWYLRLACLARLRLFNQTAAECTTLFAVLNAVEPPESKSWLFERLLPFELEVMHARLKYWSGDHMGYLDALYALMKKCKFKAREAKNDVVLVSMWKERGARVCLILASQLIEMKDFTAAAKLLEPLCPIVPTADASPQSTPSNINANPEAAGSSAITGSGSPALRSAIARIYLQVGNLPMATQHFSIVASDPEVDENTKDMNEALLASAEGEWETATAALRRIVTRDPENYVAINNLSVTLLSQGDLSESIQVLEAALASSPSSVVVAEPYLFNLSTLYELRSAEAMEKKKNLLIEVAKWSGDGLRTTCLKMPTN
ncbi:hypothetical protein BDN72DRAFT_845332 [Pluteus cervinus]|uniref:Uncharacterized protein n=1 Tax=Pluteus cervinus TaxID=181527 RepID=A0ACD3AJQ3_9AGAR|nr:hypothetical protein BDN72DRAFT_845332 [Pluteus cervinus]